VKFRLDRTNCVYLHDFDMCHLFDHTAWEFQNHKQIL
jgi:hypothetical protein